MYFNYFAIHQLHCYTSLRKANHFKSQITHRSIFLTVFIVCLTCYHTQILYTKPSRLLLIFHRIQRGYAPFNSRRCAIISGSLQSLLHCFVSHHVCDCYRSLLNCFSYRSHPLHINRKLSFNTVHQQPLFIE